MGNFYMEAEEHSALVARSIAAVMKDFRASDSEGLANSEGLRLLLPSAERAAIGGKPRSLEDAQKEVQSALGAVRAAQGLAAAAAWDRTAGIAALCPALEAVASAATSAASALDQPRGSSEYRKARKPLAKDLGIVVQSLVQSLVLRRFRAGQSQQSASADTAVADALAVQMAVLALTVAVLRWRVRKGRGLEDATSVAELRQQAFHLVADVVGTTRPDRLLDCLLDSSLPYSNLLTVSEGAVVHAVLCEAVLQEPLWLGPDQGSEAPEDGPGPEAATYLKRMAVARKASILFKSHGDRRRREAVVAAASAWPVPRQLAPWLIEWSTSAPKTAAKFNGRLTVADWLVGCLDDATSAALLAAVSRDASSSAPVPAGTPSEEEDEESREGFFVDLKGDRASAEEEEDPEKGGGREEEDEGGKVDEATEEAFAKATAAIRSSPVTGNKKRAKVVYHKVESKEAARLKRARPREREGGSGEESGSEQSEEESEGGDLPGVEKVLRGVDVMLGLTGSDEGEALSGDSVQIVEEVEAAAGGGEKKDEDGGDQAAISGLEATSKGKAEREASPKGKEAAEQETQIPEMATPKPPGRGRKPAAGPTPRKRASHEKPAVVKPSPKPPSVAKSRKRGEEKEEGGNSKSSEGAGGDVENGGSRESVEGAEGNVGDVVLVERDEGVRVTPMVTPKGRGKTIVVATKRVEELASGAGEGGAKKISPLHTRSGRVVGASPLVATTARPKQKAGSASVGGSKGEEGEEVGGGEEEVESTSVDGRRNAKKRAGGGANVPTTPRMVVVVEHDGEVEGEANKRAEAVGTRSRKGMPATKSAVELRTPRASKPPSTPLRKGKK